MQKTVYLHIGTFKTGTSSLQRFLFNNRDSLRERGYLVPQSEFIGHHPLAQSIAKDFAGFQPAGWLPFQGNHKNLWEQLCEEVANSSCSKVLISSEIFCDLAHEACRNHSKQMIRWLGRQLASFDVRIICYLRPLDAYAKSFYKEQLKITSLTQSFADWLGATIEHGSIHVAPTRYLNLYADQFGADKMIIRSYEREALVNGNTIDDFLQVVGLPPHSESSSTGEQNLSLPDKLADIKRTINSAGVGGAGVNRRVSDAIGRLPTSNFDARPDDSGENALAALRREHQEIAERYDVDLGPIGDPFSDPVPTDLSNEGTLMMVAMLWKELREMRARVEDLASKLESGKENGV